MEQDIERGAATVPQLHYYDMGPCVRAFSTTRRGGYSQGAWGEFNINRYCGDSEAAVSRNRAALCHLLGIGDGRLLMPHQTHQTRVAHISSRYLSCPTPLEGYDALTTDVGGVCIGVSTADCIPLLLYDEERHAACAVHAGWRGTLGRIAQHAVEAMRQTYGSRPAGLRAQVGPGISLESFEVGDEVYDAFCHEGFDMHALSRRYPSADPTQPVKWHIDLPLCNRQQLLQAGLSAENIGASPACTYQHPDTFFSARRLGIRSGRIFTAIMLE